jgi:TolA-binding protein
MQPKTTLLNTTRGSRGRRARGVLTALFAVALNLSAVYALTVDNVIMMHKGGVPASALITTIQSTGETFSLTLDDQKKLKAAGVPQSVIDAMMPSKSSAEPEPEPEPEPEAETETPSAQINAEAQRRIEEAVAKEKAKIQAEKLKQLKAALSGYESSLQQGRYAEALKGYDEFLNSGEKSPEGISQANFGVAEALFGMGFYANAMVKYQEILEISPDENPVFQKAFNRFRQCVQMIGFDGLPGSLSEHYVGGFSQDFQDSYFYFIGKSLFKGQEFEEARLNLEKVSNKSPDYARAQYVLGLIAVKESSSIEQKDGKDVDVYDFTGLIKANRYFQEAITLAEREEYREDLRRVIDLSYLSLARIAYKLGDEIPGSYDAALFYYRKVPTSSTNYSEALYESAWAYFLKGNVRRGMGIFHALDGPDWANHYLPDTHLLEAQVFLNFCYTGEAKEAISRLKGEYLDLKAALQLYLETYEESIYSAFIHKKLKNGVELPRRIYLSVLSDSLFYDIYNRVSKYSREVTEIERNKGVFGDDLTARLLERARMLEDEGVMQLSQRILEVLRERVDELTKLEEQRLEMEIGIETQEAMQLEDEISQANQEGVITQDEGAANAQSQQSANLLVGEKYLTWPFEGEFWADEINNYRSYLKSQCKEEM